MVESVTPAAAAAAIRSGDEVVVDTSRPTATLAALADRSDLTDVVVTVFGYPYVDSTPLPSLARREWITLRLSMVPPDLRDLVTEGTIEYVPRTVYQAARRPPLSRDRRTVGLIQAPPLTGDHRESLGCLSTIGTSLVGTADLTVVEENPRVPRPPRSDCVDRESIDYTVETDSPLPTLSRGDSDVANVVARHVATVVPEGATLQLGVGGAVRAVGSTLADRGSYSLWTGLLGESARPLLEAGCVEDATACVGVGADASFYRWLSDRDSVQFVPGTESHSPAQLADRQRFVAVNSALQVDLLGQVNAESLGGRQVAGVGGQSAFVAAASNDPEGRSIIALESRAPNGTSKLVAALPAGEAVTTPRYAVDAVVTEHGVARLTGRSKVERAAALLAVAHPDDQSDLRTEARDRGLL